MKAILGSYRIMEKQKIKPGDNYDTVYTKQYTNRKNQASRTALGHPYGGRHHQLLQT